MEALAFEYPDIYQQFMENDQPGKENNYKNNYEEIANCPEAEFGTSVKDSNSNIKIPGSERKETITTYSRYTNVTSGLSEDVKVDDMNGLMTWLEQSENHDHHSNQELSLAKSAYGCSWSRTDILSVCGSQSADICPFVTHQLGLGELQQSDLMRRAEKGPQMQRVVVLRKTPHGLVKLQEGLYPLMSEDARNLQRLSPQDQIRHLGITPTTRYSTTVTRPVQVITSTAPDRGIMKITSDQKIENFSYMQDTGWEAPYKPPPNAVLVKVPSLPDNQNSQVLFNSNNETSLPPSPWDESGDPMSPLLCSECDTQFTSRKALTKHARNQHLVYQCSRCGEQTVGYYKMASHTKRSHSREPTFFCPCGRNFSEKKGMSKHQNTCSFSN